MACYSGGLKWCPRLTRNVPNSPIMDHRGIPPPAVSSLTNLGYHRRDWSISSLSSGDENSEDDDDKPDSTPSSSVQEDLVKSLNFEISAKRNLDEHVEDSSNKLRALAEDAKEEMDRAAELAKLRGDLAFDSALADIQREADKYERKLRKRREAMEQESREFKDWERDMVDGRNEGQFFGNLYQHEKDDDDDDLVDQDARRQSRRRVIEPAKKEATSPARLYIFAALGAILVAEILFDVLINENGPSLGLDSLYGALALYAAWLVANERKHLGGLRKGAGSHRNQRRLSDAVLVRAAIATPSGENSSAVCPRGSHWQVHKFGGTCVATSDRINEIAEFLRDDVEATSKVAVVSAMGSHPSSPTKVTDLLINMTVKSSKQDQSFVEDLEKLKEKHVDAATALLGKGDELDAFLEGLYTDIQDLTSMLKAIAIAGISTEAYEEFIVGHGELWCASC
eukprot:jgi/Picre1/30982/NNA_006340.t1